MARKPNEKNERIKRRYLEYRKHARRLSEKSLDKEIAAIERFDDWNKRTDFAKFHIQQAMGFAVFLQSAKNPRTNRPFGKSTIRGTMGALRAFFLWLSQQEGYRTRIRLADADYFNVSRRDEAEARAAPARPAPTPEQVRHVLARMPDGTDIEKRNRAIVALLMLTGVRDGALVTLRLKHVDIDEACLVQNPREVATKFGKAITTYFVQGFPLAETVLAEWVRYQRETLLRGDDDPLFPKTEMGIGPTGGFRAVGLSRGCWSGATAVCRIVAEAFTAAGVQNFGPHAFRHMLARQAQRGTKTIEEFQAISQNLGHASMLTTLGSYGDLTRARQRELIRGEG